MHLLNMKALGANFVILWSIFVISQEKKISLSIQTMNELVQMNSPKLIIPSNEKNNKIVKWKTFLFSMWMSDLVS